MELVMNCRYNSEITRFYEHKLPETEGHLNVKQLARRVHCIILFLINKEKATWNQIIHFNFLLVHRVWKSPD